MASAMGIDNHLMLSWVDSSWLPALSSANVLDYFAERSNPFYDRSCNNEILRMQRRSQDHLVSMVGIEYTLLHTQDPILYVIRKQRRHSPTQTVPLAHYNIIAGIVYRSPDLGSVINSRLLNSIFNVQSAFKEAQEFARYTPSKGYFWQFKNETESKGTKKKKKKVVEAKPLEQSSLFQRQRVDECLSLLSSKFSLSSSLSLSSTAASPSIHLVKSEEFHVPEIKKMKTKKM